MAFKLQNLGVIFKDAKTRAILLVTLIIILVGVGIAWIGLNRIKPKGAPAETKLQAVPGIQSIPAVGTSSREYTKLQEQENILKAQQAQQEGTSAIPTLTRTTYLGPSEFSQPGVPSATQGAAANPDCSPEALARARAAGVKAEELRCKGCTLEQLRAAGYTAGELMNAGYSANELKAAGFSVAALRAAGFTAAELSRAGFSANDLVAAGFNAAELNQAGIGTDQLSAIGLSAQQLAAAGLGPKSNKLPKDCSPAALIQARQQGVTAGELRRMGCGATALKAAGFSAKELKDAGFNAKELRAAGFTAEALRNAGFTAGELRQAGFSAKNLSDAGFGADELRQAGYNPEELTSAGYTPDELTSAGFSKGDLQRAGIIQSPTPIIITTPIPTNVPTVTTPVRAVTSVPSINGDSSIIALEKLQKRQAEQLSLQERQDRIAQMQQAMSQQANDLFSSWSPPTKQQYTAGEYEEKARENATTVTTTTAALQAQQLAAMQAQLPVIKAGTIMFGVLDTSLNSDEPSPILATLVDGPYKGARLVGQFQRVDKKVILSFNVMNIPSQAQSITVNAVAIDPNTARTALASHVDNHYLLRYGTLFASSFLSGLGQAINQSDSTTNITLSGITTTYAAKSAGQEALIGLGNVGQQFANVLGNVFNRPPTVQVKSGEGIGLLFMNDVTLTAAPTAANIPTIVPTGTASPTGVATLPTVTPNAVTSSTVTTTTQTPITTPTITVTPAIVKPTS